MKPFRRTKAEREPFLAFATDDVTRAVLVRIAGKKGWPESQIAAGGVAEATRTLAHIPTPRLLVVDLSGSANPVHDIGALADVCDEGTKLIALGEVNDVNLFRQLMEIGVNDYLLKPVAPDGLSAAIARAREEMAPPEKAGKLGRVVGITGARGGVGASTIAVDVAWLMAHEQKSRVVLVDLDLYFGTTALALDLEPGRGFREALESPNRIDGLFLERALVRVSETLFLLGAEEALENSFSFDPQALDLLLENLRKDFDIVVIDLPRFAARTQLATLVAPAAVVIVSDPSLAGMRDTGRLAKLAKQVAPDAELRVVLNRVGAAKQGELAKEDFERGAELSVDYIVPFDAKPVALSAGAGKAMAEVAHGSRPVRVLREISRELAGAKAERAEGTFWHRLAKKRA